MIAAPTEFDEICESLGNLRRTDRRAYRQFLGVLRALYLEANPRPFSRSAYHRELHAAIKSKVSKADVARAKAFRAERARAVRA